LILDSQIDCGANSGVDGSDVQIISQSDHSYININEIDDHELTDMPLVTAGVVA
jgi:hypothetical protein